MRQAMVRIGSTVALKDQGEESYLVQSHEMHRGIKFYRLAGIEGGLFLGSSLVRIKY